MFSKSESDSYAADSHHGFVRFVSFIISGCQPSVLFDPVNENLDGRSFFVHFFVQGEWFLSLWSVGDYDLAAPTREHSPYPV